MYYQTFHIKLPDYRCGFPPKVTPPMVDGILHIISKKEFQANHPQLEIMLGFGGGEIVKLSLSRPFSEQEFHDLPKKR